MFNLSLSSNELFHSNFLYWISKSNEDMFKKIINGLVGDCNWWKDKCREKKLWKEIEVRREYKNFDLCIVEVIEDAHNKDDIFAKYGQNILMYEEMPEVLAGAMGDHAYMARFETDEEIMDFIHYVIEKKEG